VQEVDIQNLLKGKGYKMEDIKLWHATNIEEYLQADIDKPRKEIY
jgi:hypothetical protein